VNHKSQILSINKRRNNLDVIQAIKDRRSCKAFKSDPVPKELLKQIIEASRWAPSAQNIQPWDFYVLGEKVMEDVKARLTEKVNSKAPAQPEIPVINLFDPYLKRSNELKDGIDKHQFPPGTENLDQKRAIYNVNGGRFHNAPNGIIICTEKSLTPRLIIDAGIAAQTICLAAYGLGLGACIMARPTYFPDILRDALKIPDSKIIVISVALGYPDPNSPLNTVKRSRVEVNDLVHWCGI
jgi:nitroreductase